MPADALDLQGRPSSRGWPSGSWVWKRLRILSRMQLRSMYHNYVSAPTQPGLPLIFSVTGATCPSPNYALHALPYLRHQYPLLSPLQALHACLALPLANFFKKKQNKNRKASTTSNVYHATYNFSPLLPTLSTTRPPLPRLSTPTDTKPACGNIQTRILFCAPG